MGRQKMSRLMGDLIVDLEGHWNEVVYYSQSWCIRIDLNNRHLKMSSHLTFSL